MSYVTSRVTGALETIVHEAARFGSSRSFPIAIAGAGILGLSLYAYNNRSIEEAAVVKVAAEYEKSLGSLRELYTSPSKPPMPLPILSYKIIDCAVAPQLPQAIIERKFLDAARGFSERWTLFAKGKTFTEFQLEREEASLEAEFKNIRYMRRAAWFVNPHESLKESTADFGVAPALLFADGARSRDCMAFAYNHTDTNYNASIMHLGGQKYIASEGPREKDVDNFFRTLVAYKVTHLVRLTCAQEGDVPKCHPYWEGLQVSEGEVTTLNIPVGSGVSCPVRIFDMEGWRDNHGVNPKELLALVLRVRKAVREKDGLLAIHCSAGVGRTGTFMAALAIVDAIDKREAFSIEELVCRLSLQRFHSVGKPSQYVTLHRVAEEYIKFKQEKEDGSTCS